MFVDPIIMYLIYGHLFIFTAIYFVLDPELPRNRSTLLLMGLILGLSMYVAFNISELDLLLLFSLYLFLSLKRSKGKNITLSLLSVSFAYIIEWLITWGVSDFVSIILSTEPVRTQWLFFLVLIILLIVLTSLSVWLSRHWLLPFILSHLKGRQFSYVLTGLVLIHQTYKLYVNHGDTPFLSLLILVFYLALGFLIFSVVQTFNKNEALSLTIETNKLEYELMAKYAAETKKQSLEMRKFRHDYINILSSIEYYLAEDKLDELKDFYYQHLRETKSLFENNMLRLTDLERIDSLKIKSILTTKLIAAQEKEIAVQLEISDIIPSELKVDPIILIRILGILLDNAIEELETLTTKKMTVAIFLLQEDVVFVIQNSARDEIEPLHQLKQPGFSTKGENRGLGLANVAELLTIEPHVLLETTISPNTFTQKLTIVKGV
ncbi:GHKL domain-containing protein [Vagococcus salmoninarum]|uniref:GHKL domain-containing protein n=1 Tax=Vagococcus salmoninarum TaxID=2739 RepID=UPI003F9E39C0